jgi:protein FAM50
VYSYWDGTGHRRTITVPKGTTIFKFLEWVRQDLIQSFPELRSVSADSLLYVKEDLIIPHTYSFYDLITTKVGFTIFAVRLSVIWLLSVQARGKSGPLFQFDVHEDIRMSSDSRIEKGSYLALCPHDL